MLIDCRVFDAIGLFDERFFFYYEDIEFCTRARRAGFQVAYAPDSLVEHVYAASVSRVAGLREFHLARNRQVFFRLQHRNLQRLWYTLHEVPHLLHYIGTKLRRNAPADALRLLLRGAAWPRSATAIRRGTHPMIPRHLQYLGYRLLRRSPRFQRFIAHFSQLALESYLIQDFITQPYGAAYGLT
ncbi:MAG: glycosyltransferase, partial [Chloroflexaceae bacterium]|nr:glycosyltransferase [Chloroflexaceae bacterium]